MDSRSIHLIALLRTPERIVYREQASIPGAPLMTRRTILPVRGNPMRPMMIFLAAAFGVMLIGFTALMIAVGLGAGGTITVAIIIVIVAVIILAVVRYLADAYEEGRQSMLAGDTLAEWRLSRDEH